MVDLFTKLIYVRNRVHIPTLSGGWSFRISPKLVLRRLDDLLATRLPSLGARWVAATFVVPCLKWPFRGSGSPLERPTSDAKNFSVILPSMKNLGHYFGLVSLVSEHNSLGPIDLDHRLSAWQGLLRVGCRLACYHMKGRDTRYPWAA